MEEIEENLEDIENLEEAAEVEEEVADEIM